MTAGREDPRHSCSQMIKRRPWSAVRRTADHGLRLPPLAVERDARRAARGGRARGRRDHRRGPQLHRRVQRADGRDHPQRGAARARRLPLAGQRPARRRRCRRPPRRPSRAPTSSAAARPASGRTTEALLAAYRIGARVSWREMSTTAVRNGLDAETLVAFAELVFAYIDELSAASVAGPHRRAGDDRPGAAAAARADRPPPAHRVAGRDRPGRGASAPGGSRPGTLTAVIVPESQVRPVLASVSPATLAATDAPDLDESVLLLVPDAHGHRRTALLRTLGTRGCTAGPAATVARGARVVRPGPARPRRRPRARHRGAPGAAGPRRRPAPPAPTCAPSCSRRSPTCGRARPRS